MDRLTQIIYVSEARKDMNQDDIKSILTSSRKNNDRSEITGFLIFNKDYFLQVLEGSRENVNKTYHTILNDTRHMNPVLIEYSEITERSFAKWAMGYLAATEEFRSVCKKYSGTSSFQPMNCSAQSNKAILLEAAKIYEKKARDEEGN